MKMAGGCVAPQSRIDSDMLLAPPASLREALRAGRPLPAAHFDRNATTPVTDLVHWRQFFETFEAFCSKILCALLFFLHTKQRKATIFYKRRPYLDVCRSISQNLSPAGATSPFVARAIPTGGGVSVVPVSGR
jgi:hypothetical protein